MLELEKLLGQWARQTHWDKRIEPDETTSDETKDR